jgi:hypothetical protein
MDLHMIYVGKIRFTVETECKLMEAEGEATAESEKEEVLHRGERSVNLLSHI